MRPAPSGASYESNAARATPRVVIERARVAKRRLHFAGRVAGALAVLAPFALALLQGFADAPVPGGSFMSVPPWVATSRVVLVLGGLLALVTWAASRLAQGLPAGPEATLAVSGERLHVRWEREQGIVDELLVRRDDLREVRPLPNGVVLRSRALELEILAPAEAVAALLASLELSASARAVRFPIASVARARAGTAGTLAAVGVYVSGAFACGGLHTLGRAIVGLARGLVDVGHLASTGVGALLALVPLLLCLRLFARRSVTVGADAVRIDGLVRRKLVPLAELSDVADEGDDVVLRRNDGKVERLPKGGFPLSRRIQEALVLHASGGDPLPAALERGERSTSEWVESLVSLVRARVGYRGASVDAERLLRIAEDPAGRPAPRAAAAVALSASEAPDVRERLRVAAQASADLELKAILEQAAEGEAELAALERVAKR